MQGAKRRMDREVSLMRWQTWHSAALPMAQKFPDFRAFMNPGGPPDAQASAAQLLARVAQWDARIKQDRRTAT
jgi:hypothetical protein